jgi:SAM-dependent methyltransferase
VDGPKLVVDAMFTLGKTEVGMISRNPGHFQQGKMAAPEDAGPVQGELKRPPKADYSACADAYQRARPGYPESLVDALVEQVEVTRGDPVAELGAGTGNFTRLLSQRGFSVTALEPDPAMSSHASAMPGVAWTTGTFEHTGLASGTQRWVVSAQAFHWARADRALPEIRRVLAPACWFTTLRNSWRIEQNPALEWTAHALRRHIPEYRLDRSTQLRRLSSRWLSSLPEAGQRLVTRLTALSGSLGTPFQSTGDFGRLAYHEEEHRVRLNRELYLDLWRSRSRLRAIAGPQRLAAFLGELGDYLDRSGTDLIEVGYVCGAWSARVACDPAMTRAARTDNLGF